MKFDTAEIKRALKLLEEHGKPTEIEIAVDNNKLKIATYSDMYGHILITLYDSDASKFAEVTKTERL